MSLQLQNTLSGKKEFFKPVNPDHVRIYACGPTVYNFAHIGNARMAVVNDLLVRVLKTQFKQVTYVSNITDIDDKIIEASKLKKKKINEITEEIIEIFHENCKSLNCLEPTVEPKACLLYTSDAADD